MAVSNTWSEKHHGIWAIVGERGENCDKCRDPDNCCNDGATQGKEDYGEPRSVQCQYQYTFGNNGKHDWN